MATSTDIGPLTLVETGEQRDVELVTTSKKRQAGRARIFEASLEVGTAVEFADVAFVGGERDLRLLSRRTVEGLDRLVHGLRVGVRRVDARRSEIRLRIPAPGSRETITFHQADLAALDSAVGIDVKATLIAAGAIGVNRRELALGDRTRSKQELCAVFDSENYLVPAVGYAITPLLAFWRQFC